MSDWINILIAIVFSALFSGIEIAFITSNKLGIELQIIRSGIGSKVLSHYYKRPDLFISTMLVGNNIALVIYGILMSEQLTPLFAPYFTSSLLLVAIISVLSTILILVTAEFLPKTIFRGNPNFWMSTFAIPIYPIYLILFPISKLTTLLSKSILRLFGIKIHNQSSQKIFGKTDLDYFVQQNMETRRDDKELTDEVKIFQNALDFDTIKLRECMIPRTEVEAIEIKQAYENLKAKFIDTGFSRLPVYENNMDNIVGYIHSSELFNQNKEWQAGIKDIPVVPESMTANNLMKRLLQKKKSIALVVDEYGGTSGIVTLEDLVEEIFGEIEDEHDTPSLVCRAISDHEYIISGRTEIETINEKFELNLPESDEYLTLAGYLLHELQHVPRRNEEIEIGSITFKIVKATRSKIEMVRLKVSEL